MGISPSLLLSFSLLLGACAGNGEPVEGEGNINVEEVRRTWLAATVRLPNSEGVVSTVTMEDLLAGNTSAIAADTPLVLWLHGCSGIWSGTVERAEWLASHGFAVIAPSSPAREFYPVSCNPSTFESGLYRNTLALRHEDVAYALDNLGDFPWLDTNNVFLMGFSEGAAVTATYQERALPSVNIKARVAESWTCNSGWPEYAGLSVIDEPVLALLAKNDPWYTAPWHKGDCGEFMTADNDSESLVFDGPQLGNLHGLLGQAQVRELVINFLLLQRQKF